MVHSMHSNVTKKRLGDGGVSLLNLDMLLNLLDPVKACIFGKHQASLKQLLGDSLYDSVQVRQIGRASPMLWSPRSAQSKPNGFFSFYRVVQSTLSRNKPLGIIEKANVRICTEIIPDMLQKNVSSYRTVGLTR